jgi:hypothetical protein
MKYEYTEINRIREPHKYMYTPYYGISFIDIYFKNRLKNIKRFDSLSTNHFSDIDLYFCVKSISQLKEPLERLKEYWDLEIDLYDHQMVDKMPTLIEQDKMIQLDSFKLENEVDTESLLSCLILNQLRNKNNRSIKKWLNLLIQRFEVTKKMYKTYQKGFRTGKGREDNVRLYWMLALLLSLCYIETHNAKYLSSLLKVSDLLCSLSNEILTEQKTIKQGLMLVLFIEISSVRMLTNKIQGVDFAFK